MRSLSHVIFVGYVISSNANKHFSFHLPFFLVVWRTHTFRNDSQATQQTEWITAKHTVFMFCWVEGELIFFPFSLLSLAIFHRLLFFYSTYLSSTRHDRESHWWNALKNKKKKEKDLFFLYNSFVSFLKNKLNSHYYNFLFLVFYVIFKVNVFSILLFLSLSLVQIDGFISKSCCVRYRSTKQIACGNRFNTYRFIEFSICYSSIENTRRRSTNSSINKFKVTLKTKVN